MADDQQDGAEHQHRGGFTLMVDIVAKDGSDGHSQQREHGEDGLGSATHVAHVAVNHQSHNCQTHKAKLQTFVILNEVARERASGNDKHQCILHPGHRLASPIGARLGRIERQVALQHIDGILLEREDGAIVKYAKQGHQPESEAGEDLAEVTDFEGVVLLFSFTGLGIEFLVHEEVDNEHHESDAEQHHTEGDGTRHANLAAELSKEGAKTA